MSDPAAVVNPPVEPPADVVSMKQAELDALISGRVSAALAAERKKAGEPKVPEPIAKELEELRAERKEREVKALEAKGEYAKALEAQANSIKSEYEPKLKERDERIAKGDGKLREVIVTNALLSAAAEGNAVAPAQVVRLLEHRVKLNDELVPVVYDEDGNPAFVADKQMTPAQLVETFLRTNPHFVKASGGQPQHAKGGPTLAGDHVTAEIDAKAKEVEALGQEVTRTGSAAAIVKHAKAVKELKALQLKASA